MSPVTGAEKKPWTFLTNHARVLVRIVTDPGIRMRDIATQIGITERTAQVIIADLEAGGYLERQRVGRRNVYTAATRAPLRHPADTDADIRILLALFTAGHEDDRGLQDRTSAAAHRRTAAQPTP